MRSVQDAEATGFHPRDGNTQRDEQQLDRDRCGQGPSGSYGRKLLTHQEGDRKGETRRSESGERGDQGDGSFVAVLGADPS